jgi:hypothetical protein
VGVVYKLPFALSTKRCETILVHPEQQYKGVLNNITFMG